MAEELGRGLAPDLPHSALHPERHTRGMGVISRFPIRTEKRPEMAHGASAVHLVRLEVEGLEVCLANVHPLPLLARGGRSGAAPASRILTTWPGQAAAAVLDALPHPAAGPLLVAGDFNLLDRLEAYRRLAGAMMDCFRSAGLGKGGTFPVWEATPWVPPVLRLDYVFVSEHWKVVGCRTGVLPGSDHRYVVADLELAGEG
jgi:endonuclease/exonuclease/phosphatase (EEP) superfamily protein YafD